MLGNAIKQTTATTGTGSLTLSAVTGYPMFSDAFPLNAMVSYCLLDSAGLFIEAGIGYLSSSSVLVRNTVRATFVSSVYNDANPTAASLSGATTVICAPHAATMESMLPTVDNQSSSVARYLLTASRSVSTTPVSLTALRLYHVPFLLRTAARVVSLSVSVTTLGAGSVIRAGLYACNEKGYMGALLATTGDLDGTTTGVKTGTLSSPVSLPPGWYFTSVVSSATVSVTGYQSAVANVFGGGPLGFSTSAPPVPIDYRYETLGSAVLPASANATTTASSVGAAHIAAVYVGVQ
jgi:hypothetical protein